MIDHILTFASEAAAHTALDPFGYGQSSITSTDAQGHITVTPITPIWDTSRCIPNIQIITVAAVIDPVTHLVTTPQVIKPGWWILCAGNLDANLQGLTGQIVAILDRDGSHITWVTPSVLQAIALSGCRISPVFMGSSYLFGV